VLPEEAVKGGKIGPNSAEGSEKHVSDKGKKARLD